MYAAYQLDNIGFSGVENNAWLRSGQELETANSEKVREAFSTFATPDRQVDAGKIMEEWFRLVEADVFISHARADKNDALMLSGRLRSELGLTSFIDSCVWDHADKLLKQIDDDCCYQSGSGTYSYDRRNITTAHVHMMLSTALTQMMDQSECVMFLRTENSLKTMSVKDTVVDQASTRSPWLFHEISMMKMLRRRRLEDYRNLLFEFSKSDEKRASASMLTFNYPVDLAGIPTLTVAQLNAWANVKAKQRAKHSLDLLYNMVPPHPGASNA